MWGLRCPPDGLDSIPTLRGSAAAAHIVAGSGIEFSVCAVEPSDPGDNSCQRPTEAFGKTRP